LNVGVSQLYQTRRNLCHRCDAGEINGTANATQGQALPQLHEIFAGRDQRRLKLLNVSCGTGRFLDFAKQAWPPAVGLDMSEAYVKEASVICGGGRGSTSSSGAGNKYGPGDRQDAVTSIFMFHCAVSSSANSTGC
jgi:SAM-dependent methyltransferase